MNSSTYFRDSKYKLADLVQWVLLLTGEQKLTIDFTVSCALNRVRNENTSAYNYLLEQ